MRTRAEPFFGDDPPANAQHWGFTPMASFERRDPTHENFSHAAATMTKGDRSRPAVRSARSAPSCLALLPPTDRRGFADLWSSGHGTEPLQLPLNHNNSARLHQEGGITPIARVPCVASNALAEQAAATAMAGFAGDSNQLGGIVAEFLRRYP